MHPCSSSEIESFGYDPKEKVLGLKFHRGGLYSYREVGEDVFREFLMAPSKGSFFHRFIKDRFETVKPLG